MGYNAAKKAYDAIQLAKYILAIELICDGQALDCYEDRSCSSATGAVYQLLRTQVPELENDAALEPLIEAVAAQVMDRAYIQAVEQKVGKLEF